MTAADDSILIASVSLRGYTPLGAGERAVYMSYPQLQEIVSQKLGAEVASLFAQPMYRPGDTTLDWYGPAGASPRRYDALSPDEQRAALATVETSFHQLGQLAASIRDQPGQNGQFLGNLIEKALTIPDETAVWLVGTQVVLVLWGVRRDDAVDAFSLRQFIERERRRLAPPLPPAPEPEPEPEPIPSVVELPPSPPESAPAQAAPRRRSLATALGLAAGGLATIIAALAFLWPRPAPIIAVDDTAQTLRGQAVSVEVLANDSFDAKARPAVSTASASHGDTEVVDGGAIRYTPRGDFTGEDAFDYSIRDAGGRTATAKVRVAVEVPPNRPPVAENDHSTGRQHAATQVIDVLANDHDPDGDKVSIADVTQPRNGSVRVVDGKISYRPFLAFRGDETFQYKISDGRSESALATVSVSVPSPKRGDNLVLPQCGKEPTSPPVFLQGCWEHESTTVDLDKNKSPISGTERKSLSSYCFSNSGDGTLTVNTYGHSICKGVVSAKINQKCELEFDSEATIPCNGDNRSLYYIDTVKCVADDFNGMALCSQKGGIFSLQRQ